MSELERQIAESKTLVAACREALHERRVECDRAYLNLIAARTAHYDLLDRVEEEACTTSNSGASSSAH